MSQLAGFAKKDDLAISQGDRRYEYIHLPALAPTQEMLDGYKKQVATGSVRDSIP